MFLDHGFTHHLMHVGLLQERMQNQHGTCQVHSWAPHVTAPAYAPDSHCVDELVRGAEVTFLCS